VQPVEDGLDGVDGEREGDDRSVLPVARLVGDDVVDLLVVEHGADRLALARRDGDLDEAHGRGWVRKDK
jgi:hypothetical protein